jgi:phage terminase large subunit GpA-like protein
MVWGGSATNLTTRPCRYLLRDEVDELKKALGDDQIDPMKAIEETTSTFSNRKIVDTGTPTTPQGNIWKALETCQYVFEYWVACRNCGVYQILYWDGVRYGDDPDPEAVETNAYYECEACKTEITNLDKIRMLAHGEWRARTTPNPCEQIRKMQRAKIEETISLDDVLKIKTVKKIGFQLPKWYSPFMGGHLGIIAKDYLLAEKKMKDGEDFAPMRNWTIYCAALPYEETAISVEEHELEKNKIDLPEFIYPKDTIAITCGIDPGQKGFWFASIAWKWDMTPHLLHYGFLYGSYEGSGINDLLAWKYRSEDGSRSLPIWRIGIDTGGGEYSDQDATMTEEAYQWIRLHRKDHPGLLGTKGMSHSSPHRVRLSKIEKMPGEKGALIPGGIILLEVNTDELKDAVWFHLRIEEGKPGRFTFHNNVGLDLMRHLTAEGKILDVKKNKFVWVRKRANHLLDCVVTAFALADPEFQGGIKILQQTQGMPGTHGRRVISKGVEN